MPFRLQLAHIIPKAKGGCNRVSNLVLACKPCNRKKGTQTTLSKVGIWEKTFPVGARACPRPSRRARNLGRGQSLAPTTIRYLPWKAQTAVEFGFPQVQVRAKMPLKNATHVFWMKSAIVGRLREQFRHETCKTLVEVTPHKRVSCPVYGEMLTLLSFEEKEERASTSARGRRFPHAVFYGKKSSHYSGPR